MMKLRNAFYVLVLALFCCKKLYNPPASSSPNSYLVVEGVINPGNDSTVIKISRTVKLNDKITDNPVLGATVTVESDQNSSVTLYDINNNGHYYSPGLNLSSSQKYRLRIKTNTSEYLSDFAEVKLAPPIDSVGYKVQNGIVNLYVNTHDPANKTGFYRWDYEETWQFHAKYQSVMVLDTTINTIVARRADQLDYDCFGNDISSHIVLFSTEKLGQNVVFQNPLTQMALTSEKAERRYSILVKQYALTPDAFNFYQNLEKNSEQLGSIFDAQPSQLSGNIHSESNPQEPVIGYVTVSNVQIKRIYINHNDLPGDIQPIYPYDCSIDTAYYSAPKTMENQVQNTLINRPIDFIPVSPIYVGPVIVGFTYSTIPCTDCTLRGSTQAPYWWVPGPPRD
jgi:hypothetical protein